MRLAQVCAQRGYKKPKGCYSGKPDITALNTLERAFNVTALNQWWVSDIIYIHTQKGFFFLAVVMDLFVRSIVGWSMFERMTNTLAQDALMAACWRRKPETTVRLHSDQDSQYSNRDFRKLLSSLNMEASMSRCGNCWGNAVAESFGNLKKKRYAAISTKHGKKQSELYFIASRCFTIQNADTRTIGVSPMNDENSIL